MNYVIAPFTISINFNGKFYVLNVKQVEINSTYEIFEVWKGNRVFEISSNRPLLWSKELYKKRIAWHLQSGNIKYASATEVIIKALDKYVKDIRKS